MSLLKIERDSVEVRYNVKLDPAAPDGWWCASGHHVIIAEPWLPQQPKKKGRPKKINRLDFDKQPGGTTPEHDILRKHDRQAKLTKRTKEALLQE